MKKVVTGITAAMLILNSTATLFAAPAISTQQFRYNYGCRNIGFNCYSLMWDENGNFLDKGDYEANLDKAISDGLITSDDKEYFLQNYDYCMNYAVGFAGCSGRRSGYYR